ncbi:MAG: ATP-binding protein, partial [Longimicrobiales bacterium]
DEMRALQVVTDGRIVYTMPLAGNEQVLGYDLRTHPSAETRAAATEPAIIGRLRVTGPLELLQGGMGLIVQQPLYRPDGRLWGRPSLVFDVPSMLRAAGLGDTPRLRIAVRRAGQSPFFGDTAILHEDALIVPVTLTTLEWEIAAVPESGWLAGNTLELRAFRGAYIVIAVLVGWLIFILMGRQLQLETAIEQRTGALHAAASQIEREEERLRIALQASGLALWSLDVRTDTLDSSPELLHLLALPNDAQLTSALFYDHVSPADRERLRAGTAQLLKTGDAAQIEYKLLRADGGQRTVLMTATLQNSAAGEPARVIGAIHDITERRELEEKLRQSQKMESIGTLAGGIAHDFNNLLTAIMGHGEFAMQSLTADNDVRLEVEAMLIAADRARLLTGQLLAFSRRQILEARLLEVNEVVRDVARLLHRIIGEDIRLELNLARTPIHVRADAGQLTQVLLNLATNARDAMPRGGHFRIGTEQEDVSAARAQLFDIEPGEYARIRVEDSGVGMDAATAARIFDPYFTTKPVGKGTGLGLATVYGIVRQSNGHIWVESEPDRGSRFHVLLPVVAADS